MDEQTELAARPAGDGMPMGNVPTLPIMPGQAEIPGSVARPVAFEDDAAATIVWEDYSCEEKWIDKNSWLMEWQYADFLYQSPNFDRDVRGSNTRPARISRFNIAKNRNTMSCQTRRAVLSDSKWFVLEPRGKLAGMPDQQTYLDAWTEIFLILSDRAELDYNLRLFIECQALQGTAIAIPGWEERRVIRKTRKPEQPPQEIKMPDGTTKKIHTLKSDTWKVTEQEVPESWPFFEYRRLGTTLYNEKWRHPNRPELSGFPRIDVDYVTFDDLRQMRELDCYKDIPSDGDLEKYFWAHANDDAMMGTQVAQELNQNASIVMHAEAENKATSKDPTKKELMKIAWWDDKKVIEILVYDARKKVIRNEEHGIGKHAAGYTANWFNIDNSGYGFGIGRVNAGDQRMSQGVLNEVLKMIAYPLNAPILYDMSSRNAPTQNTNVGFGTWLGIDPGKSGDVGKAVKFMEMPEPPEWAWRIYQLAMQGGEQQVGADEAMMQGQLPGPRSSVGRTAAGVNRLASKADENISDPVEEIERVLTNWLQFLWMMVQEQMPIGEIREILSDKYGEAILDQIDGQVFMDAKFNIKILAGQKLAAKAAIAQLIPFLMQLLQQPQLTQFMHEKGQTINFGAIERIFLRMSELAGEEDIIIPLTDQEKQMVMAMQPGVQRQQADANVEQIKGKNKLAEVKASKDGDLRNAIVDKALEHVEGSVPLDLAEARLTRNTDIDTLQNGVVPQ